MRGGDGIKSRFLVMMGSERQSATGEAARQFLNAFGDIVELRAAKHPGITLVRPDGYVAYSSPDGDAGEALGSLRSLLEKQAA